MHIPTIRIASTLYAAGYIIINVADFDPAQHQLYDAADAHLLSDAQRAALQSAAAKGSKKAKKADEPPQDPAPPAAPADTQTEPPAE